MLYQKTKIFLSYRSSYFLAFDKNYNSNQAMVTVILQFLRNGAKPYYCPYARARVTVCEMHAVLTKNNLTNKPFVFHFS